MREPIEQAGGMFLHPVVHGLNPFGPVSGVPLAIDQHAVITSAEMNLGHAELPEPDDTFAVLKKIAAKQQRWS